MKEIGMLFNNRRQSRDRKLIEYICNLVDENKIWITSFSKKLFEKYSKENIIIDDDFITKIDNKDYCFIENMDPSILEEKVDKIILFDWGRVYPADTFFDINLENWYLESEKELSGSSHEKIVQKIYIRGE